jgi:hypothetical protein
MANADARGATRTLPRRWAADRSGEQSKNTSQPGLRRPDRRQQTAELFRGDGEPRGAAVVSIGAIDPFDDQQSTDSYRADVPVHREAIP